MLELRSQTLKILNRVSIFPFYVNYIQHLKRDTRSWGRFHRSSFVGFLFVVNLAKTRNISIPFQRNSNDKSDFLSVTLVCSQCTHNSYFIYLFAKAFANAISDIHFWPVVWNRKNLSLDRVLVKHSLTDFVLVSSMRLVMIPHYKMILPMFIATSVFFC